MASVLSATDAAGTARFVVTAYNSSTNPLLRSRSTTTAEVDFKSGDSAAVTVSHSLSYSRSNNGPWQIRNEPTTWVQRQVNGQLYVQVGSFWGQQQPFPGQPTKGVIGGFGAVDIGLLALPAGELHLVPQGPAKLGEVAVTRYVVEANRVLSSCSAPVQLGANGQPVHTEIWVDHGNRLRAVRTTVTFRQRPPAHVPSWAGPGLSLFRGTVSTTTYLRITDLGAPVHVAAPQLTHIAIGSSGAIAAKGCPRGS